MRHSVPVAIVVAILSGCGAAHPRRSAQNTPGHAGTASTTVGVACQEAARELRNAGLPQSELTSFLYDDVCVKYWP
jgi:hypothetical protein